MYPVFHLPNGVSRGGGSNICKNIILIIVGVEPPIIKKKQEKSQQVPIYQWSSCHTWDRHEYFWMQQKSPCLCLKPGDTDNITMDMGKLTIMKFLGQPMFRHDHDPWWNMMIVFFFLWGGYFQTSPWESPMQVSGRRSELCRRLWSPLGFLWSAPRTPGCQCSDGILPRRRVQILGERRNLTSGEISRNTLKKMELFGSLMKCEAPIQSKSIQKLISCHFPGG